MDQLPKESPDETNQHIEAKTNFIFLYELYSVWIQIILKLVPKRPGARVTNPKRLFNRELGCDWLMF